MVGGQAQKARAVRDHRQGEPLGDAAESSFRQAMLSSQGDMSIFFSKKLVGVMTTLALLLLFWPLISLVWSKLRGRR